MLEKTFTSAFNKWIKYVYKQTAAFELKSARSDRLPFSAVVEHQRQALLNAKKGVLVFKIPDAGYQNPFDTFCLAGVPAFVVVRYPDGSIYGIDIENFLEEERISEHKSLSKTRAKVIHSFSL